MTCKECLYCELCRKNGTLLMEDAEKACPYTVTIEQLKKDLKDEVEIDFT